MQCTKQFSIAVTSGIDWSQLIWVQDFLNGTAAANFNGASFNFTASGADFTTGDFQYTGTMAYNGPAVNAQLDVTVAANANELNETFFTVNVSLQPVAPNILAKQIAQLPGGGQDPPGVYNYPFTVPDTGGISRTIEVIISVGSGLGVGPSDISGNGTFSNV